MVARRRAVIRHPFRLVRRGKFSTCHTMYLRHAHRNTYIYVYIHVQKETRRSHVPWKLDLLGLVCRAFSAILRETNRADDSKPIPRARSENAKESISDEHKLLPPFESVSLSLFFFFILSRWKIHLTVDIETACGIGFTRYHV